MSAMYRPVLFFLIFLNGYISLSLELVVLRQLSFFVGSSAVITSIIMGCFLGFMSLGYFSGASKKIVEEKIPKFLSINFLIIGFFAFVAGSFSLLTYYFNLMYSHGITIGVFQTFVYSLMLLSLGPFLFGVNTTLLSRVLHKYNTNYTGNIMAWDTIGSVTASMMTTLFLMPFIGVNYTIILIVVLSVMCAVVVNMRPVIICTGIVLLIPVYMINSDSYQLSHHGILVNNANSTIFVENFSNGDSVLNMNGLPMSIYNKQTGHVAEYIEYINENFIYNMPADKQYKILILGAGGFTAGLKDTVNDYTFVDIEHTLQDVSEKYFLGHKLTANKKFIVQDASQFLKNATEKYDLILLDVYSNSYQVPEGLITSEFMQRIKSCVAPNGIVLMNMVSTPSFRDAYTRVFDNTFHKVFTHNTSRQVVGVVNPWTKKEEPANIIYIYYNKENNDRIYTINRTPVIYDVY